MKRFKFHTGSMLTSTEKILTEKIHTFKFHTGSMLTFKAKAEGFLKTCLNSTLVRCSHNSTLYLESEGLEFKFHTGSMLTEV